MKRIWIVLVMMSVAVANAFAQEQDENLIRKFLMEVPEVSNVEASECWNEELFKLLEQKNYIVVDVIGTLDSDIQSRILEHLRNPIHDGIDVEKIYHDIKASRPQATSVINAVFDALQNSVITLDLEGETYGNYWVVYDVVPNDMVARTLRRVVGNLKFFSGFFASSRYSVSRCFILCLSVPLFFELLPLLYNPSLLLYPELEADICGLTAKSAASYLSKSSPVFG